MTSPDGKFSIFCDSCLGLKLGILDSTLSWKEYQDLNISKSSTVLFKELHRMLEEHKIDFSSLENIFLMMGPGSYTGIRLLQGMKDLYSTWGLDVYGFYAFETPRLSGIKNGKFLMSAYKGEYYTFDWNGENEEQALLTELPSTLANDPIYSIYGQIENLKTSSIYEMIRDNPQAVFSQVRELGLKRNAFYFRPLEKEFNVSFPELG